MVRGLVMNGMASGTGSRLELQPGIGDFWPWQPRLRATSLELSGLDCNRLLGRTRGRS